MANSIVDTLHTEHGIDIDTAYVVANALGEKVEDDFSDEQVDMMISAGMDLARSILAKTHEQFNNLHR